MRADRHGQPAQTLTATRQANNSYSVTTSFATVNGRLRPSSRTPAAIRARARRTRSSSTHRAGDDDCLDPGEPDQPVEATSAFQQRAGHLRLPTRRGRLRIVHEPPELLGPRGEATRSKCARPTRPGTRARRRARTGRSTRPRRLRRRSPLPAKSERLDHADFSFTDGEARAAFLCQLDGGGFSPCTSPQTYASRLRDSHVRGQGARPRRQRGPVTATPGRSTRARRRADDHLWPS